MHKCTMLVEKGTECESNTQTYIFQQRQDGMSSITNSNKLWQIIPSLCVSTFSLSFGMMLGWPSPSFLTLLGDDSPLPIIFAQSPLVAAFVMYGNIFGTPFSNWKFYGTKYGIMAGLITMSIGWTLLWQATNIYHLFISRFIVGVGNGYGVGQVKIYMRELCETEIAPYVLKIITPIIFLGVVIVYTIGAFVEFRSIAFIALFITICVFFIVFLLPHSPQAYLEFGRMQDARNMLKKLKPFANVDEEIQNLCTNNKKIDDTLTLIGLLKASDLRARTVLIVCTTFVQQFSGAPATIVYGQYMFTLLNVPEAKFTGILYALLFLIGNIIGMYLIARIGNKKLVMFAACASLSLILGAQIANLYYNLSETYRYTSLTIMSSYIFVHGCSLTPIPFTLADYLFPGNARNAAAQLHIICFSLYAIIITKLFQVFLSAFQVYAIYALFMSVCLFGCVLVLLFIPSKPLTS